MSRPREGRAAYYRAVAVLATVACVAFLAVSLGAVAVLGSQLPWWAYHLLVAVFVVSLGAVYSFRAAADSAEDGESVSRRELAVAWALVAVVIVLTYVWGI